MDKKRHKSRKKAFKFSGPEPEQLLSPVIALLRRSGVSDSQLQAGFKASLSRAKRTSSIDDVRMGSYYSRGEVIDRWLRHPMFANSVGKPLELPLRGNTSISTLVSMAKLDDSPKEVIKTLLRFGNVKKTPTGKYQLVKRYMNYKAPGVLPYEPNAQFIVDAISSATRGMGNGRASKALFWLNAEHKHIPQAHIKKFLHFVQSRGIVFLHEINDWLDQHAAVDNEIAVKRRTLRRVGVGLFPICSR